MFLVFKSFGKIIYISSQPWGTSCSQYSLTLKKSMLYPIDILFWWQDVWDQAEGEQSKYVIPTCTCHTVGHKHWASGLHFFLISDSEVIRAEILGRRRWRFQNVVCGHRQWSGGGQNFVVLKIHSFAHWFTVIEYLRSYCYSDQFSKPTVYVIYVTC